MSIRSIILANVHCTLQLMALANLFTGKTVMFMVCFIGAIWTLSALADGPRIQRKQEPSSSAPHDPRA